jgi:hypothetical protein
MYMYHHGQADAESLATLASLTAALYREISSPTRVAHAYSRYRTTLLAATKVVWCWYGVGRLKFLFPDGRT